MIVLVLSLGFLVSVIIRSARDESTIGILKSSVLAVLFNGLGDNVEAQVSGSNNQVGRARSVARLVKVKLAGS